ncbi:hypothetical protein T4D_15949 [Trichinella pseudospiralis]|uniref:Uncharacterized protein n=1 Tax=Trichinella pseudospiralis TaxID=6337 RepID=A0A0V1FNI3_TRIPS|nr:hypothetical protein T4D_15949 [Trichinella pseudospiralis]
MLIFPTVPPPPLENTLLTVLTTIGNVVFSLFWFTKFPINCSSTHQCCASSRLDEFKFNQPAVNICQLYARSDGTCMSNFREYLSLLFTHFPRPPPDSFL